MGAILTTAEKVETVMDNWLRSQIASGAFGSVFRVPGAYRVEADGKALIVWTDELGWCASFKGAMRRGEHLYEAARDALVAGAASDVSTVEAALAPNPVPRLS